MRGFTTVLLATIKEHARRKVVVFFFAITFLVIIAGVFLARLGQQLTEILGGTLQLHELLSVGILGLVTTVAALILSMGTVRPALTSGEADVFLTRPISRGQWVLGRLGAAAAIVTALTTMAAVGSLIAALASDAPWSQDMLLHWGSELFGLVLLILITAAFSGWFRYPALAAVCGYLADQAVGGLQAFHTMVVSGDLTGPVARFIEVAWFATPKVLVSPLLRRMSAGFQPEVTPTLVVWALGWMAALTALCVWRAGRLDAS